ncbi:hypothetical protein H5U35_05245, partial [Candidatus Aerophobetes bacterium]|nr:hypothetical protein [Candidatus Aerophobetes bacterium]
KETFLVRSYLVKNSILVMKQIAGIVRSLQLSFQTQRQKKIVIGGKSEDADWF